jgi:hypothetical protein
LHFQSALPHNNRQTRFPARGRSSFSLVEVRAMWICPKCAAKVDEGFEICWSCGTSPDGVEDPGFDPEFEGILGEKEYKAAQEAMQHQDLVTVATGWKAGEIHILRSRLEAEGIHVYMADEMTVVMDWFFANAIGGIKIQVAEKDAERARKILEDKSHHEVAGAAGEEEE